MRLLIIEDNVELIDSLRDNLGEHFKIDASTTGEEGLRKATSEMYDIIMLDLDLPDRNGMEVCTDLRHAGIFIPMLILTAIDDYDKKVHLLDTGADDYVTKPFNAGELRARLQALLRRSITLPSSTDIVVLGEVAVDLSKRTVMHAGSPIELRRKEFDILEYLVRNRGRILTRSMISNHVSDLRRDSWSNVVDVYIKRLRDKLERPFGIRFIETIHGIGYTIKT